MQEDTHNERFESIECCRTGDNKFINIDSCACTIFSDYTRDANSQGNIALNNNNITIFINDALFDETYEVA